MSSSRVPWGSEGEKKESGERSVAGCGAGLGRTLACGVRVGGGRVERGWRPVRQAAEWATRRGLWASAWKREKGGRALLGCPWASAGRGKEK